MTSPLSPWQELCMQRLDRALELQSSIAVLGPLEEHHEMLTSYAVYSLYRDCKVCGLNKEAKERMLFWQSKHKAQDASR